MLSEKDILNTDQGLISAPAGCGKTHLIAETLKNNPADKPILVLTHTNAGVAALNARLERLGVPKNKFQVATIDGWAIKLASSFPMRSQLSTETLKLLNPWADYPKIRNSAATTIQSGHLEHILPANYERLLVDEYQDCSGTQHNLVMQASNYLPVCAFGDPLQAIFNFGDDRLPNWQKTVCKDLPLIGELNIPWRWKNTGEIEFEKWLLQIRKNRIDKKPIDLNPLHKLLPPHLVWRPSSTH